MKISVLILTKNEQRDLPGCLDSVSWADEIVVYDSFSTDETRNIATHRGARIVQRVFDDWSTHQNWGLRHICFRHPWVLYLDADERVTAQLKEEIAGLVDDAHDHAAFRVRRRDYLNGHWLRHVQASPYYIRLFRPECIRYERLVNPVTIVKGNVGELRGCIDHFPFSKGYSHWIERHNAYSSLEALQIVGGDFDNFSLLKAFTERDFHKRRRHQKTLFYRIPARPLLKFLLLYFGRLGFLDGRSGFTYALLQSIYEFLITIKVRELRIQHTDPVPAKVKH